MKIIKTCYSVHMAGRGYKSLFLTNKPRAAQSAKQRPPAGHNQRAEYYCNVRAVVNLKCCNVVVMSNCCKVEML